MTLTDDLLRSAYEDTELLRQNAQRGDVFSRARDVEFLLKAPSREKAELVASFVSDNQYGKTAVQGSDEGWTVLVVIHMPIEQHLICSVSGLMTCLGTLFGLEYDGWGSVIQSDA